MTPSESNPTVAFLQMKRALEDVDTADILGLLNMLTWNAAHHLREPDKDVLHPFTAAPVLQYVTQAALLAASDKPRKGLLTGHGLCWTVQMGHEVLSPAHLPDDTISKMSLEELTTEFFAPLVRHQGRLQSPDFLWTAAQQWQLFTVIPHRDAAALAKRAGGDYIDIPAAVEKHVGLSVEDVYAVACALYSLNMTGIRAVSEAIQAIPGSYSAPHEKLLKFVDEARRSGQPLAATFTVRDLQTVLKDATPRRARAWLNAFSAPPSVLKRMTERERRYTSGELTFQLLPLESVPVVRLGGGRYIVPNAHSLIMGLPHLPELHAMRTWPAREWQRLRTTLGYIQETYLEQVSGEALRGRSTLIPEREYRRPETVSIVRGPDLSVIEPSSASAVLVESKATLFADGARAGAGVEPFAQIDARMTDVVLKANWKAADLLDPRVGTYAPFRAELAQIDPVRMVTVIVHAEHLHGYNVTWLARRRSKDHPLHGRPVNFIALSLEEYTHFLDAARQLERPLHDLIREQINEIEVRDFGFDHSVLEEVGPLDDKSILRRQFLEFMGAVEQQWLSSDTSPSAVPSTEEIDGAIRQHQR